LIISLILTAAVMVVAGGRTPSSGATTSTVTVALTSLSPTVAVKGGTLHLAGALIGGPSAHSDVIIRMAVADMQVRSDLSSDAGMDSRSIYDHDYQIGTLAAGARVPWSMSIPVSALTLTSRSVYALDVVAYSDGERIGIVRTYLPYAMGGDSSFHATQMAVLWPLTAAPTLDGQSDKDVPEAVDGSRMDEFAPGGRLERLVSTAGAAKNVAVSWAVDPDLLTTANGESHGYSLYPNGDSGVGAQDALGWLTQAKNALGGAGELWQLPATDPDLGSLGAASSGLGSDAVGTAAALSGTTVADLVGRSPLGMLAWPADGQADANTLRIAKVAKPSAVIVRSDSIDLHTQFDSYTPTGRAEADGTQLAISDTALDAIFDGDAVDGVWKGSNRSLLASQRLLAETALISLELPNLTRPRTVMVAASRTAEPDPALLTALGQATWVKTVGLSTLLDARPDTEARTSTPQRDPAVVKDDLSSGQLAKVDALRASLQLLAAILTQPVKATGPFDPAVLRTVSTAWRPSATPQEAFASAVQNRLEGSMDAVSLVQKSDLTLSGKSGVIPFTIENRFSNPVRVGIRITTDHSGLTVQSIALQTVPQGTTTVNVHVSASVSGTRVLVTAQLVTPGGATYGDSQSLQVTVSSIGSITLVIFGLSAAVLVMAVGLRIYRGRRTRLASAAPDPSDESADNAALRQADRQQ
jgi:hypothetical protein